MIRCIQIGTVTVQGELRPSHYGPTPATACVRYEGGKPVMAEFGRIVSTWGLVYGRLTESKRAGGNIEEFDSARGRSNLQKPQTAHGYTDAVKGLTEHERQAKAPWLSPVKVCPICDIAGCRHIRRAGNG